MQNATRRAVDGPIFILGQNTSCTWSVQWILGPCRIGGTAGGRETAASTGQNTVLPAHSGLWPPFTTEKRIHSGLHLHQLLLAVVTVCSRLFAVAREVPPCSHLLQRRPSPSFGVVGTRPVSERLPEHLRKRYGLEKLIKSACNCLLSVSQALELEIHASIEFSFKINTRQLFRPFGYSSIQYFVMRCRTFQVPIF